MIFWEFTTLKENNLLLDNFNKFNKPLIKNENYRDQIKALIKHVLQNLDPDNIVDPQFRWEYLK